MLEFVLALVQLAGKIIIFLIAIKLFWTLITKGKGVLSDLVDTMFMAMRTVTKAIQRWLFQRYKGPKEQTKASKPEATQPPQPQTQSQSQAYQPQPQPTVEPPPYNWNPYEQWPDWQSPPPDNLKL